MPDDTVKQCVLKLCFTSEDVRLTKLLFKARIRNLEHQLADPDQLDPQTVQSLIMMDTDLKEIVLEKMNYYLCE